MPGSSEVGYSDRTKIQIDFFRHLTTLNASVLGFYAAIFRERVSWIVCGIVLASLIGSLATQLILVIWPVDDKLKWYQWVPMLMCEGLFLIGVVAVLYHLTR